MLLKAPPRLQHHRQRLRTDQLEPDRLSDLAQRRLRLVSSHGNPFRAITDSAYLQEGEAAVVAPGPGAGFTVIGRIGKDAWATLDR